MKKIIAYSFNLLFLVTFLASCLGDLDTMPLDNNQLVSDQVYKTKDGYTGVLAKCYSSLILTGQQGGDGGNGGGVDGLDGLLPGGGGWNQLANSAPQPSPAGGGVWSSHSRLFAGQRKRTCICARCANQGRTLRNQSRSLPAVSHSFCLIAGLTKMRVTSLSLAASLISSPVSGRHCDGITLRPFTATKSIGVGFKSCC